MAGCDGRMKSREYYTEFARSEEHTSELQSQPTISYAVFCLKKVFFFFNDTATTEIYTSGNTLSLHDALPIWENKEIRSYGGLRRTYEEP